MNDKDTLLEMLNEDRSILLLAIADAYEEEGNTLTASAYRWLGMKKRWPSKKANGWGWRFETRDVRPHYSPDLMPRDMKSDSRNNQFPQYHYETAFVAFPLKFPNAREAIEAVVELMTAGHWTIPLDIPVVKGKKRRVENVN